MMVLTKSNTLPDYGNWVPIRLLCLLAATTMIPAILLALSIINGWSWQLMALFIILFVVSALFLCYMAILYDVFSSNGGGLMEKVHEYVTERLPWDGHGLLLDVGCGAGALTIRCAKKFPEAHCVGIERRTPWGASAFRRMAGGWRRRTKGRHRRDAEEKRRCAGEK